MFVQMINKQESQRAMIGKTRKTSSVSETMTRETTFLSTRESLITTERQSLTETLEESKIIIDREKRDYHRHTGTDKQIERKLTHLMTFFHVYRDRTVLTWNYRVFLSTQHSHSFLPLVSRTSTSLTTYEMIRVRERESFSLSSGQLKCVINHWC